MPQSTLPTELFRPIIESGLLDQADLCSVARASRTLRDEGQRVLFRDPGMITVQKKYQPQRATSFFNAIISSPHRLALMVHTYTQSINRTNRALSNHEVAISHLQDEPFTMMTQALKLMVNLRILHLDSASALKTFSMVDCLQQCKFKLRELTWGHRGEEIELLEYLSTSQDDIQSLTLHHGLRNGHRNTKLQRLLLAGRQACPKLESLRASVFNGEVLLPGKQNVKYIAWTPEIFLKAIDDTDDDIHVLEALHGVQFLQYERDHTIGLLMTIAAPYFTSLVVLVIRSFYFEEISKIKRGFPSLRLIHFFHESRPTLLRPMTAATRYKYISLMFKRLNKLQYVFMDGRPHTQNAEEDTSLLFMISPQTGEVTRTVVKLRERWWVNRVQLVADLSDDSSSRHTFDRIIGPILNE